MEWLPAQPGRNRALGARAKGQAMAICIAHPFARPLEERRLHMTSSLSDPIVRLEEHYRLVHRDLALLDAVQLQR